MTLLLALALWFQVAPVQIPPEPQPATPQCVYRGLLPDPACTPGATDPRVTQDTIQTTICVSGYTDTIRPSSRYTTALKRQQMVLYGLEGQPLSSVEEDHLVALSIGGAPYDPANLFPEPIADARHKDVVELAAWRAVCAGSLELDKAQWLMARDWRALGVLLGVLDVEAP
jgi:hypothetical protein